MAQTVERVPDWIAQPYRRITEHEEDHGGNPQRLLSRYATSPEVQDAGRRAVAMWLFLFREYISSLDRWATGTAPWQSCG